MPAPATPGPTPIPTPADFPVTWNSPEEAMLHWAWEQQHMPLPITPLFASFVAPAIAGGLGSGLRALGAPVASQQLRRLNTYGYMATVPDFALIEGTPERVRQSVGERGFTMFQHWNEVLQPKIEALNQRVVDFDYAGASDAALLAQLDFVVEATNEQWQIHFQLFPGFYIPAAFKDACARLLGLEGLEAYEMMQGAPNLSVESGSKLWQLAHAASPLVRETVHSMDGPAALTKLRTSAEGQSFLRDLQAYLDVYGWRTGSFDVLEPLWVENPAVALEHVRLMLGTPTDPADEQRRGAERAETLAGECRVRLAGNPAALGEFEALLAGARNFAPLLENHNFHIDTKGLAVARFPFREAGRRMAAAGLVASADDYAYLEAGEIRTFLNGDHTDRRALTAERKAEMEHWRGRIPPAELGARPPAGGEDPFELEFGGGQVEQSRDPKVVKGIPGARGTVTGTARVVRSLSEAGRVQEGDILICDMTTPAWTPLFASLKAIVADSGGPLSHCAIVAREFGLPCVTATRVGTQRIPDGATITVDGAQGLIRIE